MKFIEELKSISNEAKKENEAVLDRLAEKFKDNYLIQYGTLPFKQIPEKLKKELYNSAQGGFNDYHTLTDLIYSGEEVVFPVEFGTSLIEVLEDNNTPSNINFVHKVVDNNIKEEYTFMLAVKVEGVPLALQIEYNAYHKINVQTVKVTPHFHLDALIPTLKEEGFQIEETSDSELAVIDGVIEKTKRIKISW